MNYKMANKMLSALLSLFVLLTSLPLPVLAAGDGNLRVKDLKKYTQLYVKNPILWDPSLGTVLPTAYQHVEGFVYAEEVIMVATPPAKIKGNKFQLGTKLKIEGNSIKELDPASFKAAYGKYQPLKEAVEDCFFTQEQLGKLYTAKKLGNVEKYVDPAMVYAEKREGRYYVYDMATGEEVENLGRDPFHKKYAKRLVRGIYGSTDVMKGVVVPETMTIQFEQAGKKVLRTVQKGTFLKIGADGKFYVLADKELASYVSIKKLSGAQKNLLVKAAAEIGKGMELATASNIQLYRVMETTIKDAAKRLNVEPKVTRAVERGSSKGFQTMVRKLGGGLFILGVTFWSVFDAQAATSAPNISSSKGTASREQVLKMNAQSILNKLSQQDKQILKDLTFLLDPANQKQNEDNLEYLSNLIRYNVDMKVNQTKYMTLYTKLYAEVASCTRSVQEAESVLKEMTAQLSK